MKLVSEKMKVVAKEKIEGVSQKTGKPYSFTKIYANLENGIQINGAIPNELAEKCEKGKNIQIVYDEDYGRIYAKEIIQCQ